MQLRSYPMAAGLIAGGSFWNGAGIGLISSGLNHAAHQVETKFQVHKEVKEGIRSGLLAKDGPTVSRASVEAVTKLRSLARLKRIYGRDVLSYNVIDEVGGDHANYFRSSKTTVVYRQAFKSWVSLATTFGHEMAHHALWHIRRKHGLGPSSTRLTELFAYHWSANYSGRAELKFETYQDLVTPNDMRYFNANKHRFNPIG